MVSIILGEGGGQILINVFEFPIFSPLWYFSNKYFPNQTFFSQVNIALNIYTITNLLFLTTHIPHITNTSISIPLETWIRAPAYIFWRTDPLLCHTSLTFALCCAQRHEIHTTFHSFHFPSYHLVSDFLWINQTRTNANEIRYAVD